MILFLLPELRKDWTPNATVFLRDQSEFDLGAVGEPVIALPLSAQSGDYLSGKDADEAIDAAMERKRAKDAEFMNSTLTVPK